MVVVFLTSIVCQYINHRVSSNPSCVNSVSNSGSALLQQILAAILHAAFQLTSASVSFECEHLLKLEHDRHTTVQL